MTPYYTDATTTVYAGDCLDALRELPDASVDAVVTDPPAGISFMSKSWDTDHGGRDQFVEWLTVRLVECARVMKPGAHAFVWAMPRTSGWTQRAIEDAGLVPRDCVVHLFGTGFPKSHNLPGGLGTALKPASEHWWLARKPLAGTVAANVLAHGTGALNIGACRIEHDEPEGRPSTGMHGRRAGIMGETIERHRETTAANTAGRWPANVVLDESQAAALDLMSGESVSRAASMRLPKAGTFAGYVEPGSTDVTTERGFDDLGGASRFFYTAKADAGERVRINGVSHPTVKPLALMRWLVRLVTPPLVTVCVSCDTMRYASTTPDGSTQALPAVRGNVPSEGQPPSSTLLLEGVRGPSDASDAPQPSVRGVRTGLHAGQGWSEDPAVLLETLRQPLDSAQPLNHQGLRDEREGLPSPLPPRPPDGDADGLRRGAPIGGSGDTRPDADLGRGGTSSERDQGRQPPRESASAGEGSSRPHPQAATEADQVPPLRREDRGLGSCATCGGALTKRPGIVLEPFAGSGSTVEACILEGFRCIAIEREADYLPLIVQRINRRRDPVAAVLSSGDDGGLFDLLDEETA